MKRIKSYFTCILLTLCLPTLPSLAASTDWFETDGAKLRFISETIPNSNDIIDAVLQIELEPGWKTYWREPGSSGIPPSIDFSQSKNIKEARVLFPTPVMIDDGYSRYAGYKKSVALPIEIKSNGENLHLISDIFIGVCSHICVPFSAKIDLDLSNLQTNAAEKEVIELARIGLPLKQGDDLKLNKASFNNVENSIDLNIELPSFYPKSFKPEVFLHGPSKLSLSQPQLIEINETQAKFKTKLFKKLKVDETLSGEMYVLIKLGQRSVETSINLDTLN